MLSRLLQSINSQADSLEYFKNRFIRFDPLNIRDFPLEE